MKKMIIEKCMDYIKKNTNYDKTKLSEIKYGLEGLYLTFSKIFIISLLAIVLGILKEMIIYMLIYNIIRMPSFGLHATKSWICLLSSTVLFIGIPYLCIYIDIPFILKVIIGLMCTLFMLKNAPADTKKRPLVNKKRRLIYKIISTTITFIFCLISFVVKNNFISNCLIFASIMQNCMISPTVYKTFKLPYNNYIQFLKDHPDFVS